MEKVIIYGATSTSTQLAKALEESMRDVCIIEPSREKAHRAADQLKRTVVMHGSGTDMDLFNEINMKDADFFLALSHHDENNILSALLAKKRNAKKDANSNYFMSLLIDENQLNIINFNRLIKNINGLSTTEFIEQIKNTYTVIESSLDKEKKQDEIGMYLDGKCYLLKAKKGSYKNDCVNRLDPAILSNNILSAILGIKDERTDKNISFVAGNIPMEKIKESVDSGEFAVAFILKPIPISSLKKVADNNKFMPPKSTYIEPKLRSGLTIYPID